VMRNNGRTTYFLLITDRPDLLEVFLSLVRRSLGCFLGIVAELGLGFSCFQAS